MIAIIQMDLLMSSYFYNHHSCPDPSRTAFHPGSLAKYRSSRHSPCLFQCPLRPAGLSRMSETPPPISALSD